MNRTGQLGNRPNLFRFWVGGMVHSSRVAAVLIAFLLLFSSVKCMYACAAEPCSGSSQTNLPPCHRHHAPAGHAPNACFHVLTMDAKHSPASLALPELTRLPFLPSVAALFPPHTLTEAATSLTASPPNLTSLSPVILRI